MKKKDFEKLTTKTPVELQAEIKVSQERLWQVNKDISAGKAKNIREVRSVRKDIARMMTIINSKKVTK
ncbi:MAG: 50S ribosomal protein L29 [Janthinobacterium sp.]|jgi:ribosomal protein L29